MDIFFLFFITSFLAVVVTLAVMYIRKCMNKGKGEFQPVDHSWLLQKEKEFQEKWKETLPKHSTRIKLRNSRKLRNKRKEKK